ncbi:MAG: hypothetical protein CMF62_04240 [Magnetococcales bacterium]|nr:hypothetical protein [Magnetococcales bacterium]
MVDYKCEKCKFTTNNKYLYNRHCLTKKHIRNCNIDTKKLKYLKCPHCKYKTTRKFCLDSHLKAHNKILNTNDKILEFQTKLIEKLIENSSNTTINNNTKNQNVYNYIVNNVKPSTNVHIELEKPFTKEEIDNIKNKSVLEGSYAYIHNRFINKRDYDEKILVCSDISRNKFSYYNENNEWVIDMKLRNLSELIFNKICKIVNNPLEFDSNKHNYEQFLDETKKQILLYEELKNTLKTKPTKLLNKLSKDTYIDENYISKHKILVDKNS